MTADFSVLPAAIHRIQYLQKKEGVPLFLRVRVDSGGCYGFKYEFLLEKSAQPDDHIFQHEGAAIIVDPVSFPYLSGAQLDFIEEMIESTFVVRNPQAKSGCGCGASFSIF